MYRKSVRNLKKSKRIIVLIFDINKDDYNSPNINSVHNFNSLSQKFKQKKNSA